MHKKALPQDYHCFQDSPAENKMYEHFYFRVSTDLKNVLLILRKIYWRMLAVGLCVVFLAGCESVTHAPQTKQLDGIPYYESAPYLLVYSDGHGGLKWQIKYLPDQTRPMTVKPSAFLSHAEMNLTFQNGMLTTASTMGDSTGIPKAIISAVESILPLIGAAALETEKKNGFPAPYLYKIVINGASDQADAVSFIGGQAKYSVQVSRPQGEQ